MEPDDRAGEFRFRDERGEARGARLPNRHRKHRRTTKRADTTTVAGATRSPGGTMKQPVGRGWSYKEPWQTPASREGCSQRQRWTEGIRLDCQGGGKAHSPIP